MSPTPNPDPPAAAAAAAALGPLERRVMDIVWSRGASNVRQVVERLPEALAYTTVMTTLDRLFKKGLLDRHKVERAFVYVARVSHAEWARWRAGEFVSSYLATGAAAAPPGPGLNREMLVSCLLDAVANYDVALLDELSRRIRARRRTLTTEAGK
ncbi:MAG: BlaI/MecI/CopY family transcriptional regulator [Terriglobales bacterium]